MQLHLHVPGLPQPSPTPKKAARQPTGENVLRSSKIEGRWQGAAAGKGDVGVRLKLMQRDKAHHTILDQNRESNLEDCGPPGNDWSTAPR